METTTINYIDSGIGFTCRDGDKVWIELNENLKKYPSLHDEVLEHEMEHIRLNGRYMDFMHDFKDTFNLKKQFRLFKFSLKHPKSVSSIFPFSIEKNKIIPNWFMVSFWTFISLSLIFGGYLI